MRILQKKFGTKNLVVQDILSQLEKVKSVTTDKMFIEFVEKLQKAKLDLDSLKMTSEIANASIMGKIEEKLPMSINTDWCKIVQKEDLNEGTSEARFAKMMTFLDAEKERVEYQTTTINKNNGSGSAKTVANLRFKINMSSC